MSAPLPALSAPELARYSRHLLLDEVGLEGQRRLAAARVLVIGAGGLGSPAALYLAAAGVGTLGIADFDRVELHNLQRQLLHDTAAVGEPKVASAARRLRALNPHVRVVEHPEGVKPDGAAALFGSYDIVIDGTDNFGARYVNNDAAVQARRPLIFGSIFKFEGQVAVFDPAGGAPCYRCLFPTPPEPGSVPGCGEAGVFGALCGVIGSIQAMEAIKLVTGVGVPLRGRLLTYDALNQQFQTLALRADPTCPTCGRPPRTPAPQVSSPPPNAQAIPARDAAVPSECSPAETRQRLTEAPQHTLLLDVREPWETEIVRLPGTELIPMRQVPEQLAALPRERHVFVLCHHGARSRQVAAYLRGHGFARVSNVAGGIDAWAAELDPALPRY